MKISELADTTGVSIATIKYYLREGLLPEGGRTSATSADYSDRHVRRLRIIRALIASGVSVAETHAVLAALDNPQHNVHAVLGAAHAAVTPDPGDDIDIAGAKELVARMGWREGIADERAVHGVERAMRAMRQAGFSPSPELLTVYLDAMLTIARAEVAAVPAESIDDAVHFVVLGSVLGEPLLLALRRVAQQVVSAERFGGEAAARSTPAAPLPDRSADRR